MSSYQDEVLAGFDVEQTPEHVAVRAWLAFGPDGPTTFGEIPGVKVLTDGRRVRARFRQTGGRRWITVVALDQPLGARPVVDVAVPDPGGSERARRAWLHESADQTNFGVGTFRVDGSWRSPESWSVS